MPPRLTPTAMLWTGLAAAAVGILATSALNEIFARIVVPPGEASAWALSLGMTAVHVLTFAGAALAAGSFVVRALRPSAPGPAAPGSAAPGQAPTEG